MEPDIVVSVLETVVALCLVIQLVGLGIVIHRALRRGHVVTARTSARSRRDRAA